MAPPLGHLRPLIMVIWPSQFSFGLGFDWNASKLHFMTYQACQSDCPKVSPTGKWYTSTLWQPSYKSLPNFPRNDHFMDKTVARRFLGVFKFKPWILNDKHAVIHLKWMIKLNSNDVITKSSASKTILQSKHLTRTIKHPIPKQTNLSANQN